MIEIKDLGLQDYTRTYNLMREFTARRNGDTGDQIWLLEHAEVYTLGLAGKQEHIVDAGDIPVINTDRGGQVTYHGPGQLIAYLMLDLNRRPYAVKKLVALIEQAIIAYLHDRQIVAYRKPGAPGVYTGRGKIAALGLRVCRGCTYHGLALNVDMDLKPFHGINPCGMVGMTCTQIASYKHGITMQTVKDEFTAYLLNRLDNPVAVYSGFQPSGFQRLTDLIIPSRFILM